VTRDELSHRVASDCGLSVVLTDRVVRATLERLSEALEQGQRIELRKFGVFWVQEWPGRTVVDPVTQQAHRIPSRRVARFRPSTTLKSRLN